MKRAEVIESWVPSQLGGALVVCASLFLVGVLSDVLGLHWVNHIPRPLRYFTQIACLFPDAAVAVIDYRAEGFSCQQRTFDEVDVRPYFPIERETKENRFYRAMQFYHQDKSTLGALENYLLAENNQQARAAAAKGGTADTIIGGVRLLSIRIPLGTPGEPVPSYERKPLSAYPNTMRKYWYITPSAVRERRCAELDTDAPR